MLKMERAYLEGLRGLLFSYRDFQKQTVRTFLTAGL